MNVLRDHVHKQLNISLFWKVRQPHVLLGTCHKPMHFLFPLWLNFARAALKISPYFLLLLAFFFSAAVKTISCQRTKCVICRLDAKAVRCKGEGVLYRGELLYFPASLESKQSISECCECSREIQPHRSSDSPTER